MIKDKNLPLHLKYRPQSFDEMVGNESTIDSLRSILSRESGEVRSFLFIGQSGCGKTTMARILSKELNCAEEDFKEFNSANVRGIDTIREIAESCNYAPMIGRIKIYLLDECHKITPDAQHALLKLLEDTPEHVRFILCTTDPEKLLKTIRTRCSTFHLSPLRRNQTLKLLRWVCEQEKVDVPQKVLGKIAEFCDGSPRQAIVMLDQVIDIDSEEVSLQMLMDTTIDETTTLELSQALLNKSKWETIASIVGKIDDEPEKVRISVVNYLGKVLLSKDDTRVAQIMSLFGEPFFYSGRASLILNCYLASKVK
jgi:DNA polymerase III subunit gamma/tau